MTAPKPRILIVDADPAVPAALRRILPEPARGDVPPAGPIGGFELDSVNDGPAALEKVIHAGLAERPYTMAFLDVRTPLGLETIAHLWKVDPALQIVVCAAAFDYSWETMTAQLGVNGDLLILKKPFASIEVLQIAHTLTRKWLITQQAQIHRDELDRTVEVRTRELLDANSTLRRSEERFAEAFRVSPVPLAIQSSGDERFLDVNDAFLTLIGWRREEIVGRAPGDLPLFISYESRIRSLLHEGVPVRNVECQLNTRDGDLRTTLVSVARIALADETQLVTMVQDVSARHELQSHYSQADKLEAVGQLAAGVAHDFNNLLTIIQGHSSLQLATGQLNEETTASLKEIALASERAADLTRQLLAFSRRQVIRPRVLQMNTLLRDLTAMLRSLIGDRIELDYHLAETLPAIWADQASVEQVIINLTLNARDAMPNGGKIVIATGAETVTAEDTATRLDAIPGEYVRLTVSDTGVGMDDSTRTRIFDPFFTTKAVNRGTGMGLATVHGITQQHDGWIDVTTAPGAGSSFSIFLPITHRAAEPIDLPVAPPERSGEARIILIVEDDDAVRGLVKEILEYDGYHVLEAESADAAMIVWKEHSEKIELLLTDMVMPGSANGLELSRQLLALKPELRVIYTSGYSADLFASDVKLQEGVNYLPKPYLSHRLTAILHAAFGK